MEIDVNTVVELATDADGFIDDQWTKGERNVEDGIYYKAQPAENDSWNSGDHAEKEFRKKMDAREYINSIRKGVSYAPKH